MRAFGEMRLNSVCAFVGLGPGGAWPLVGLGWAGGREGTGQTESKRGKEPEGPGPATREQGQRRRQGMRREGLGK